MTDIFDGQLRKDFQEYNGSDFLNAPRNYGLMLNFDFFQPMKHRKDYSVGVLYLVLLNLPRAERFKWENVLVVGIIPAMGKKPKNLNSFLKPLEQVENTNFNVNPLCVASMKDTLQFGSSRFLPVQRISTKCAIAIEENKRKDKRYILSPLPRHFVS